MKEKPILFSGEMVRAILDGRKTQTRRVIKNAGGGCRGFIPERETYYFGIDLRTVDNGPQTAIEVKPPCAVGDLLWVRETWATNEQIGIHPADAEIIYRATSPEFGEEFEGWKWRPSIFMPRWASRLTLRVTGVRAERVHDISRPDIRAEGVVCAWCQKQQGGYCECYKMFSALWDSINAKRGYGWDASPWVWVIEFEVVNNA
jgi:hypothetical protein